MTELERRYRWLLRAYPRAYRQYRADEMLETLLATAEDEQRRPNAREAAALVIGGLRARTGADRLDSRSALGHSALRLSALALLVYGVTLWAGVPISFLVTTLSEGPYRPETWWWYLAIPALLTVALLAAAWGRYRPAFAATIAAVAAQHWSANWSDQSSWFWSPHSLQYTLSPRYWPALLASLALLPLLRAPRTPVTRAWIWPALAAFAVAALTPNPLNGWWEAPLLSLYAFAALAAIVATPIDARIPVVTAALLLAPALAQAAFHLYFKQAGWPLDISLTTSLALATVTVITLSAGTFAGRRLARI